MEGRKGSPPTSPIDHQFVYTKFADITGSGKREFHTTLLQLAELIERTKADTKENLPLLKLATFGDDRSSGNSLRNDKNVRTITGVELDYDAGDLSWDHAWLRLYEAGLVALQYTTPSYTALQPRFRVLLPTSKPVSPKRRKALVERASSVLKGTVDKASFNLSLSFHYGTAMRAKDKKSGQLRDGYPVVTQLIEPPGARFIDQADELDAETSATDDKPIQNSVDVGQRPLDISEFGDGEKIKDILAYVPGAEYGDWLRVGMALHDYSDGNEAGLHMWSEWALEKSIGNFDDASQRSKWASFNADRTSSHVSFASLVFIAKDNGWTPKVKPTINGELRVLSTWDCEAANPPPYVWKSILGERQIGCIFGAPGAGKSVIAPYVALMVSQGQPSFGMRTKAGGVLYIAAEDSSGMEQRVKALVRRHGHAEAFHVVSGLSDILGENSLHLASLMKLVEERQPRLIVIDTLAAAFPGLEENDAKSMGQVVEVARKLTEHGAAVLLVHHDTKAEGATPRGHSVLNGALDVTIHVKRGEGGVIRGILKKNRNGTIDRDIAFQIGIEQLGIDEDGDAITAPVVEELAGGGAPRQPALSKQPRAALSVFDNLQKHGPVTDEEWTLACVEGFSVSQATERKSRQTAFRRARDSLINANLIQIDHMGKVSRVETISGND